MEGANTSKAASVATSQATPTADRNMDEELLANKEKSADIAAQGPLEMKASSDEESSDAASNPGGATTVYESTAQGTRTTRTRNRHWTLCPAIHSIGRVVSFSQRL